MEATRLQAETGQMGDGSMAGTTGVLSVHGMTCAACVKTVDEAVRAVDGVLSAEVSLVTEECRVEYERKRVGLRQIVEAIEDCGFEARVGGCDREEQVRRLARAEEIAMWRRGAAQAWVAGAVMAALYIVGPLAGADVLGATPVAGLFWRDVVGLVVATFVLATAGRPFLRGLGALRHGRGTMDTLVALSSGVTYLFSIATICRGVWLGGAEPPSTFLDTTVMLVAFISVGKLLESRARARTADSLARMVSSAPSMCTIREAGGDREVEVELLQAGDVVVMRPGMRLPADGTVLEGEAEVDESLMTGESTLVPKYPGSKVLCGSVNGPAGFLYRADLVGEETRLAGIVAAMKQAQLAKAPIQRYADFLASWFIPSVLFLALMTFICWMLICTLMETPPSIFNKASRLYVCSRIAITVIVVACPCPLGLAAPTAIMVGTGLGAEHGILFKGGDVIETAAAVQAILFDKTGTLTTGHLTVQRFTTEAAELTPDQWALVCAAERLSEHPIARAIVTYAETYTSAETAARITVLNHEVVVGRGIRCVLQLDGEEHSVVIGSARLLSEAPSKTSGSTESFVVVDDVLLGRFDMADSLREDAYEVVQELLSRGHYVGMVTGDNHEAALRVSHALGIPLNNVFSERLPEGKCDVVRQLRQKYDRVAFIGDGINDSVALAESDLGISLAGGSDIVADAAGIVILDHASAPALTRILYAIDIARATFKRIKLNLFWAVLYNSLMLPISMGVLIPWGIQLPPMAAAAGMAMSSVSVVTSSLLLARWKPVSIAPRKTAAGSWRSFFKKGPHADQVELQHLAPEV
ncbi:AaceriACR086Cp [[Ashbya] aceris (nom. inval.)]|nr:AaceriACR086Cp [[Ashbya] aceris (nom. inval.)]